MIIGFDALPKLVVMKRKPNLWQPKKIVKMLYKSGCERCIE